MGVNLKENQVKDKYGNRKRGDSWEGRVFVLQQQVSLYDADTRRLEMRKKELKKRIKEFIDMKAEYERITMSIQFITIEYYEKLRNESEVLYNAIIQIVNVKKNNKEPKIINDINEIYKSIKSSLTVLRTKNPELQQTDKKVKEWFFEWLWTYKHGHKAKTTFKGYVSKTKNHIIRVFGERYLSEIATIEIQTFINDLMLDYQPSTIKQIFLLLQEGYARAVKDKIIKQSPVVDIELPPVIPNTMMSVNLELERKLIDIFKDDEMCYPFAVLIDTGLRTSELCGLKWENIDFKNRKILIRQSYQRVDDYEFINGEIVKVGSSLEETTLKSRTSKREIPMSKGVHNILMDIFNEMLKKQGKVDEDSFVFINKIGNPIVGDCLRNRLSDILKKHNLKGISLHRFRHTFATRLYEAKVKLKNIQALLGHSTVQMTERYLHIDEEEQADSITQLENYYERVGICV